jgi:F-type H+-transporting ATPase subunit a
MIVVEFIGLFTKPFALCIRLFANMTAGHIVILSLISLIFIFQSVAVAPVSIAFALFINLLEIFIALLQAYIFTMLSSLFASLAVHQEH